MNHDFVDSDIAFFYVYKRLAHPGRNGYVDPFSIEERLTHIQEAKETLGTQIPWICDNMRDEMKHAFGGSPNSEFILDPEGKIVRMRSWSNPSQLRADLIELVGTPARRNSPEGRSSARRQVDQPPYATGVVPKLQVPSGMQRLRVEPVLKTGNRQQPFYAKLQAFGQKTVIDDGDGTLHLSFELDPIHHVHWNNLAKPLEFEIRLVGRTVESEDLWDNYILPITGEAPKVEVDADLDPREFLVDLCGVNSNQQLELNIRYFACSDEAGWCRAVSQSYLVYLERDGDTRRRMDSGRSTGGFGRMFGDRNRRYPVDSRR